MPDPFRGAGYPKRQQRGKQKTTVSKQPAPPTGRGGACPESQWEAGSRYGKGEDFRKALPASFGPGLTAPQGSEWWGELYLLLPSLLS